MPSSVKKCAHSPCQCQVDAGKKFCSQICEDAGASETEIACDCGHPACAELVHG